MRGYRMGTDFIYISRSPLTGQEAAVGKDENAYYLYLMEPPERMAKVLRILWLCNRRPAPAVMTAEGGGSILLPREFVGHDPEGIELDEDSLRINWYATGDSPVVFDREGILGAIPPYAGLHDFPGFTRYMKGVHRYGWEMPPETEQGIRVWMNEANEQWRLTLTEKGWNAFDQAFREVYSRFAGEPSAYLRFDQETFPHRRLWMGKQKDIFYNLTVGMSQAEMPGAQIQFGNEYQKFARMELGFACFELCERAKNAMVPAMDALTRLPWEERAYLGHGHTVDFGNLPGFASLLLVDASQVPELPSPVMPAFLRTSPRFCWLVPITARETAFVREKGVEELLRHAWMPKLMHIFDGEPKFLN